MESSFLSLSLVIALAILRFSPFARAQQPYIGKNTTVCSKTNDSSSPALGYACNGLHKTCRAYLIYRSTPPYNTVPSIARLLASDPSRLSALNSVAPNATFAANKMVIVPVNCSRSGRYYQANASYTIRHGDNYYVIVNSTYQGLTTCRAIKSQNVIETVDLYSGELTIPIRCACPTKNQTNLGIKYLLSYVVAEGNSVSRISARFGASVARTLEANGLSEQYSTIYPFTTLLVPLRNPPLSNQTIIPPPPPGQLTPPPPSQLPTPPASSSRNKWVYAIAGFLVGAACTLVIGRGIIFGMSFRHRNVQHTASIVPNDPETRAKPIAEVDGDSQGLMQTIYGIAQAIKVYSFEELLLATNDFSPSYRIKGCVHRGEIDGCSVAIKKVNGDAIKEINILKKINHFNIVRLSGICFNDGDWYFVYDFAAHGSLSDWIYNTLGDGKTVLSWTQRVQIALDMATGLNYLHGFTSPPHIHKNVTSGNVLLDGNFRAKITNLGMARSAEGEEGRFALTSHIVGTRGYMAPEYLENGLVSTALDVYAFGVLAMEMITGKEAESLTREESSNLFDAMDAVDREDSMTERLVDLIDPSLGGRYPLDLAAFMIGIIRCCLKKNAADRPDMDEIVRCLSGLLASTINWESSHNVV
ncbi:lysM domain receptor-like kinase 4 [Rhodamnia argentea]|uniref:LysM domain receptor-like kinase 4 n=1 Tax=Rhodamnia argentea TaxID=178133 RepID=A0A8B8P4D5_9MYRT|nr:lysM domain receptor-like kinase 4 [Rhodamnia argentea]